jgi:hypothetical protein
MSDINKQIQTVARWLYKKLFNVDYILSEWEWEHKRKIQLLRNELLEEAIRKLGYRLETTLKADFFVEGDLPNAQRQSGALYELKKLED